MFGKFWGSDILSHPRSAFSRHSSNHSGSPFLALMSRMMSSLSPFGAVSASMSVTKPYLYSLLTRDSTDELMATPLGNGTARDIHSWRSHSRCVHAVPLPL